jgi:hypothetical protein
VRVLVARVFPGGSLGNEEFNVKNFGKAVEHYSEVRAERLCGRWWRRKTERRCVLRSDRPSSWTRATTCTTRTEGAGWTLARLGVNARID